MGTYLRVAVLRAASTTGAPLASRGPAKSAVSGSWSNSKASSSQRRSAVQRQEDRDGVRTRRVPWQITLVVRWPTRPRFEQVGRQSLRAWCRSGIYSAVLVTSEGQLLRTEDSGITWSSVELKAKRKEVFRDSSDDHELLIMAACFDKQDIAIAVSWYHWGVPEGQELMGTSVMLSEDFGQSWTVKSKMIGSEHEYLGVAKSPVLGL